MVNGTSIHKLTPIPSEVLERLKDRLPPGTAQVTEVSVSYDFAESVLLVHLGTEHLQSKNELHFVLQLDAVFELSQLLQHSARIPFDLGNH